jgi:hypothetical protein
VPCDPLLLTDLARGRLENKTAQLAEALDGRFNDHHAYAAQMHLGHIDSLNQRIISLSDRIDSVIAPLAWCIHLLTSVPWVLALAPGATADDSDDRQLRLGEVNDRIRGSGSPKVRQIGETHLT